MRTILCTACDTVKLAGLFSDGQREKMSPKCMKCIAKLNKAKRETTTVPAARMFNDYDHRNRHTFRMNYAKALKGIKP